MYDQRWEIAQWEKCLSFMHKDLSSNPTTMQKGWTWWHMLMVTSLGRQRHTDSCKSHRIDCLVSFRVGRRDLTSITKKGKRRQKERKKKNMTRVLRMSPGLHIMNASPLWERLAGWHQRRDQQITLKKMTSVDISLLCRNSLIKGSACYNVGSLAWSLYLSEIKTN